VTAFQKTMATERPSTSMTGIFLRRLVAKKLGMISAGIIIILFCVGILAPVLAPFDYRETELNNALRGPGFEDYLLGTDRLGRDLLTRTMYSIRTTVIITVVTVLTGGLFLGPFLGIVAGYFGRWLDTIISRIGEILSSLPALLMMILINSTLDDRLRGVVRTFENWSGIDGLISTGAYSYFLVFGTLSLFFWVGSMRLIFDASWNSRKRTRSDLGRGRSTTTDAFFWSSTL
jgi:ABC-type dipeptide/oligopeptide/nickel transport system permease subunit